MRLFAWLIGRPLGQDRLRSVVTVLGVAVGIAVVVAIRLANAASVGGFAAALDGVSGRTSLEITAPGVGIDEDRLRGLAWLREYGQISPVIDGEARLRPGGGAAGAGEYLRVLGVDILRDRAFRDYALASAPPAPGGTDPSTRALTGREFLAILTDPEAIVLTAAFADRAGLAVGSPVDLVVGDRVVPLVVRGLLEPAGPAAVADGGLALMDIAAAQLAFDRLGSVDRLDVRVADGVDVAEAERAIAERLSAGLTVARPERRGVAVERMLAAFHFNLNALSYIALIVGVFLVYNTVSVSVITRRAEIGMLRTVGASRARVLGLFVGEALVLGVIGAGLGAPLGWALAHGAVDLTAATVRVFWVATAAEVPPLGVEQLGLALGLGVPLAVLAALVPAAEAARLTPLAAVRRAPDIAVAERLPRRYPVGVLLALGLAAWCAGRPAVGGLPIFGFLGGLAIVAAAALLAPVALHVLQRQGRAFARRMPVTGELARANLAGAVRRLSISVAALAVSLAMMVAIAIMVSSFRETVAYWADQTLRADLFVSAGRRAPVADRPAISPEAEATIAAHPAVAAIDGFRAVEVPLGEASVIVASGRFAVLVEHGNLVFKAPVDGRAAVASAIGQPAVVLSESFAIRHDVGPGATIALPTAHGMRRFRVAAVYYDYTSDRGLAVMDAPVFAEHYDDRRPSSLSVYLRPDADPSAVRDAIVAGLGSSRDLLVNTNAGVRRGVLEVFDSTFAITYALEVIAIAVAMFGVAATLLTLVLERRGEIATLRLVGAGRRQLRRMIMIEAGLIGAVSQGIGLVTGLALSLILVYVINVQSFGWTIQFHLPVAFLMQASLLVVVATAVAGLYPARLAGRFGLNELGGGE